MAEIITLAEARAHLRLEDDYPPEQLQVYINAATAAAAEFLNRRIYPDAAALSDAINDLPAFLNTAAADLTAALAAADLVTDLRLRCAARDDAEASFQANRAAATEIRRGIVADDLIRAAILLALGDLFEHRAEDGARDLPKPSQQLLFPKRIGMGV